MISATTKTNSLDQTKQIYTQNVLPTYARFDVVFERGEGAYLYDTEGRKYLDFLGGIAVNALGHCHPEVVQAIQEQAAKLLHVSNLYYIAQQADLAEILCRLSGMEKAFFCNSGAEANEAALKIARKYGKSIRESKTGLVGTANSFHGRTLGTLALTGQEKYQKPFTPLVPDTAIVEWSDIEALQSAVNKDTCGILLECIQGEGGVRPADKEYLEAAHQLAAENDALLIFDEVQTGCGRTGHYFACQGYNIKPDIMTTAKAMGGGFPIGACLTSGKATEVFQPGDHGTTYGGGPLACAAAVAALTVIERDNLPDHAAKMGEVLVSRLKRIGEKYDFVEVRGKGLMQALVLKDEIAREVVKAAFGEGLIINATGPEVLRFLPPLIIEEHHIDEFAVILDKAIAKVKG